MNGLRNARLARIGSTVALAAMLGVTAFAPGFSAPSVPPENLAAQLSTDAVSTAADTYIHAGTPALGDSYIHTDAVKKQLTKCYVKDGSNNSALVEAWKLPQNGVSYYVNTSSIPSYLDQSQVLGAIQAAANAWGQAGAPRMQFAGTVSDAGTINDGRNTISFGLTLPDTASVATMRIAGGVVAEADIVLDITNPWSTNPGAAGECGGDPTKWDIQNVMTHEFGHWIGAAHVPWLLNNNYVHRTMFPFIAPGELQKRSPTAGDIASIPASAPITTNGIFTRAGDDDG